MNHQQDSGAWPYSIGDARTWADNFHTGYILECLLEYQRLSGDQSTGGHPREGMALLPRRGSSQRDMTPEVLRRSAGSCRCIRPAPRHRSLCARSMTSRLRRARPRRGQCRYWRRPDGSCRVPALGSGTPFASPISGGRRRRCAAPWLACGASLGLRRDARLDRHRQPAPGSIHGAVRQRLRTARGWRF